MRIIMRHTLAAIAWTCLSFVASAGGAAPPHMDDARAATRNFFVAPQGRGKATGASSAVPAPFNEVCVWKAVGSALQRGPVTVWFLDGDYSIRYNAIKQINTCLVLEAIGDARHRLVLQGATEHGAIFRRSAADDSRQENDNRPTLVTLQDCCNVLVKNLHFTGNGVIGYALSINDCVDVRVERCSWIDLPGVYTGATGAHSTKCRRITFRDCVFRRVGFNEHAHMIYNATGPQQINVIGCRFEDCSGEFVRFRSGADYGVVAECIFQCTGDYKGFHPFLSIPLFNDDDPAQHKPSAEYEYFGTHFLFFKNKFLYSNQSKGGTRDAIVFRHRGFDPPGRHHLLTAQEGRILENGTATQKRALLLNHCGIDTKSVYAFANTYVGAERKATFSSEPAYGAVSRGWSGAADISDLLDASEVVKSPEEAMTFLRPPQE